MNSLGNLDAAMKLGRLCTGATSLVFLLAGLSKILRPIPFAKALKNYSLLPSVLIVPAALSLPVVEVALGIAVLRYWHSPIVASLCALLLLTFATAMSVNLLRGRGNVSCGCGLLGSAKISWVLVFRNVALAGIAFGGMHHGLIIAGVALVLGLLGATFSVKVTSSPTPSQQAST